MKDLFSRLGYSFKDSELAKTALTHKSFSQNNNERLEFLGDAILNLYVSETLYSIFTDIDEGKLTRFKASIVSRENLNLVAENLGISQYIYIGKGEKVKGNSILGNTLEALVGAIFLDSNYSTTKKTLKVLFNKDFLDLEEGSELKDPKSLLQELTQKKYKCLPVYELNDTTDKKGSKNFEVSCLMKAVKLTTLGKGTTRKNAELEAAKKMLVLIKESDE